MDRVVKERTLAIVKPDGVEGMYVEIIKTTILDSNFTIVEEMQLELDRDSVASFYAEHASKSFFLSLVHYMTRYLFSI